MPRLTVRARSPGTQAGFGGCRGVGPALNTTEWINIITDLQTVFTQEGVQIPIVYGLDSVHGANYVYGATLFPQQISRRAVVREPQ